ILLALTSIAQVKISGVVKDSTNNALAFATVSLLNKTDSTFESFAVSDKNGYYEIKEAKEGTYLLQVSFVGYFTEYKPLIITKNSAPITQHFSLQNNTAKLLPNVEISSDKVPIKLKGDTLEYNAGSFKTKPDAVVEDLLKKLPGIQVDANGKIKAMGKDVKRVLVDGKEFFGDDPLIATKNLPANAISKVQTYEGKNDNALFTGIDEGEKDMTINLLLKNSKKQGYFGDVMAGGGTQSKYEASLKGFKFNKKEQIALLGLHNNINKFGFSFKDYLNFNGGITGLLNGNSSFEISQDEPIDVGQPQPGNILSTAMGANYSFEKRKNNIFNINYLGSLSNRYQINNSFSQNFLPTGSFDNTGLSTRDAKANSHRFFGKWRNNIDSMHQLNVSLKSILKDGSFVSNSSGVASINKNAVNEAINSSNGNNNSFNIGTTISHTTKLKGKWKYVRFNASGEFIKTNTNNNWNNIIEYIGNPNLAKNTQMQNRVATEFSNQFDINTMYKMGYGLYIKAGGDIYTSNEKFEQLQGLTLNKIDIVDTLSPTISNKIWGGNITLSLLKSFKKYNWNIGVRSNLFSLIPTVNNVEKYTKSYNYLLPFVNYTTNKDGKSFNLIYETKIKTPNANELLPTSDISSPTLTRNGNINLEPDFTHTFRMNYNKFSQFSFSFFNVSTTLNYTKNKIAYGKTIFTNLNQKWQYVNTPYAANASLNIGASFPIKPLNINVNADLINSLGQNEVPINEVMNENKTITHQLRLNFSNRNADKIEVVVGGSMQYSKSTYSLDARANNTTYTYTANATLGYKITESLYFNTKYELSHYNAENFSSKLTIPLLSAEISKTFLKHKRGILTLRAFDILDRNISIFQQSQQNSFAEQRSNIIGQYFMLSFKFKLNKLGKASGLVE
ncbi:MAG: TonB-dependent receptor, partial [Bacteroidetes bacterium]|nr:TonB-dependent receptor [Bacteroidota bacterium]